MSSIMSSNRATYLSKEEGALDGTPRAPFGGIVRNLHLFDGFAKFLLVPAKALLQAAQQFILFALGKGQIVIGKLAVFLFQLAFDFVPVALDLQFGTHIWDF